uniref:Uncharacterized protein n=1 Tax=Chromera velia CCMP2878 TaxID=1169474 RepID=A0A0G4IAQ0_9ALVE|mmetsp:Transcript_44362/g.87628  ORF Transcript_44362/g.87628 Transcript_44362/m.87628 type:complete len:138 (-) Transcript_44362:215-628(-)|eukprot:Cvel_12650.t1-p1 / transcript=Cvel_12650.t1 / gene=Cvel_12650 / organism=Chromera_velia_CCMP2878 / gene_product=hypothetical protein / transcript_product=hypothetical protein / location=Cvel_scaffold835:54297-55891(+) / protein_length=137 / sequence_SO=supercontig / SO=protein_coding / is_pseudo=false
MGGYADFQASLASVIAQIAGVLSHWTILRLLYAVALAAALLLVSFSILPFGREEKKSVAKEIHKVRIIAPGVAAAFFFHWMFMYFAKEHSRVPEPSAEEKILYYTMARNMYLDALGFVSTVALFKMSKLLSQHQRTD